MTLREFAAYVAQRLPATVPGVRAAGDPERELRVVAVCGGAGDSFLPAAAEAGADVVPDLRSAAPCGRRVRRRPAIPAVVDVAHWAGEWPWLSGRLR